MSIDAERRRCWVEPGVGTWEQVQVQVHQYRPKVQNGPEVDFPPYAASFRLPSPWLVQVAQHRLWVWKLVWAVPRALSTVARQIYIVTQTLGFEWVVIGFWASLIGVANPFSSTLPPY